MRIAFLGDSITEGVPGVSYVDMLKAYYPNDELINLGVGGDTIKSINKRMKKEDLSNIDKLIFFVGVNDLFSRINLVHKIFKVLKNQRWCKDVDEFETHYRIACDYLSDIQSEIVVIPPLLLGEDTNNEWNKLLTEFVSRIELIMASYPRIKYIHMRESFLDYLKGKNLSDYLPVSLLNIKKDLDECHTISEFDKRGDSRGLHLTVDGVHLNSIGATIIAENIRNSFKNSKADN